MSGLTLSTLSLLFVVPSLCNLCDYEHACIYSTDRPERHRIQLLYVAYIYNFVQSITQCAKSLGMTIFVRYPELRPFSFRFDRSGYSRRRSKSNNLVTAWYVGKKSGPAWPIWTIQLSGNGHLCWKYWQNPIDLLFPRFSDSRFLVNTYTFLRQLARILLLLKYIPADFWLFRILCEFETACHLIYCVFYYLSQNTTVD